MSLCTRYMVCKAQHMRGARGIAYGMVGTTGIKHKIQNTKEGIKDEYKRRTDNRRA